MNENLSQEYPFRCCCSRDDCHRLQEFNESFKRIEYDALLAAEIGQALLKEKADEKILIGSEEGEEECKMTYDTLKGSLHELKKLRWEKESSDKMTNLLQDEVKTLKESLNEMKKQVDHYKDELHKKKLCEKLLSIKTDIEEELKTQVSDLKQELSQLRKSENNIQAKYKRLELSYETLQLTHEILSKEHDILLDSISKKPPQTQPETTKPNKVTGNKKLDFLNMDTNSCMETSKPEMISNSHNKHLDKRIPEFRVSKTNCNKDPFDVLQSVTQQTLEKINATDTRVLNRRLRRVFDMSELSDMSNSILNTIISDLAEFKSQFDWVYDYMDQDSSNQHFFPLVNSIQQLLQEISTNKITLNDLQADYVKRIERLTSSQGSSLSHERIIRSTSVTTTKIKATTAIAAVPGSKLIEPSFPSTNNNNHKTLLEELLTVFTFH